MAAHFRLRVESPAGGIAAIAVRLDFYSSCGQIDEKAAGQDQDGAALCVTGRFGTAHGDADFAVFDDRLAAGH